MLKEKCNPEDIALKSFFLGPKAENREWLESNIHNILHNWFEWRQKITSSDQAVISSEDQSEEMFVDTQTKTTQLIQDLTSRFEAEIPKFSPRYIGHMFSETSMPALLGHILTLLHNPNNISEESSIVGAVIEIEALEMLCKMVGYNGNLGHFTSGGTVANIEALLRARDRQHLWLSIGAQSKKKFLEAAHLGWQEAHDIRASLGELEPEPIITPNLWQTIKRLQDRYSVNFESPVVIVPENKHYSWIKAAHLLGLEVRFTQLDKYGRASAKSLRSQIDLALVQNRPIAAVVGVLGSTELGTIDPIDQMVETLSEYKKKYGFHFWFHIDGAYGGFLKTIANSDQQKSLSKEAVQALAATGMSDSFTVDPHKMGYVPYSSGVFLCREEKDYFTKSFTGPYIESSKRTRGVYTLEGSRSAAGAVGTYLSLKAMGDDFEGMGRIINRTCYIKSELQQKISKQCPKVLIPNGLDSNIVCFSLKGTEQKLSAANKKVAEIYQSSQTLGEGKFWFSKTSLLEKNYGEFIKEFCDHFELEMDCQELMLIRATIMNPFFHTLTGGQDRINEVCEFINQF